MLPFLIIMSLFIYLFKLLTFGLLCEVTRGCQSSTCSTNTLGVSSIKFRQVKRLEELKAEAEVAGCLAPGYVCVCVLYL